MHLLKGLTMATKADELRKMASDVDSRGLSSMTGEHIVKLANYAKMVSLVKLYRKLG